MKTKTPIRLFALVLTAAIVCLCPLARSQTNNQPPPSTDSFFQSVTGYFTSFNPALEGAFDARGTVWTGVDSIQGGSVPLANSLGISYNAWKAISVESVTRNSGIAGTLVSQSAGVGLNFNVHDARLTLYADGGYDFTKTGKGTSGADRLYGEIGLRACKALTTHTFAGVGVGAQFPENRQVFSAFAGFTF